MSKEFSKALTWGWVLYSSPEKAWWSNKTIMAACVTEEFSCSLSFSHWAYSHPATSLIRWKGEESMVGIYGWQKKIKNKNKNIYPTNYTTECFHSSYSFRYRPPPCFFGLFSKRCCFLSRIRNLWGNLVVVPTVATSLYLLGPRFSSLKLGQKAVFTRNGVGSLLGLGSACALTTGISPGPAPMLVSS